jgi:hypothetical protein
MIDIDEVINRLLEHPAKDLYYSFKEDKFIDGQRKDIESKYKPEEACVFTGAKKNWEIARKTFMSKHPSVFPELPSRCPAKQWNELVRQNGLEKEWFSEFRLAMAESVTGFAEYFNLKEIEAESSLYLDIKKELLAFEKKHYEKKYCDMVLFFANADYEGFPMTILGNAGSVFGVSFYPDDRYYDNFLLIQNQESLRIDNGTCNAISKMLSFYFEHEPLPYSFCKDPYECDEHITSSYLCYGTLMRSYLPKSLAIRALSYLKAVNREMAKFASSKEGKLKKNCFYNVYLNDGESKAFESDPHTAFDGCLPYSMDDIKYVDSPLHFKKSGAYDATVRYLPGFTGDDEDDRIFSFTFVAIMCDHKSGYIHIHSMGEATMGHPFDNLVVALSKDLEGITLPKTIYVNTFLDYLFFCAFFKPYADKGQIKVELGPDELQTDFAFDELESFLEKRMEEEEEKYNSKKPAQA